MIGRVGIFPLLLSVIAASHVLGAEPLRLRILSYNVHHCEGVDGKLDVERIAGVIKELQPDFVALQEMDIGCTRSNKVDQPAELARLTGLHVVFAKNIDHQGGEYGNAVLSRWPVASSHNEVLPCLENGEQRGALMVDVIIPHGESEASAVPLTFISTHLDHRPSHAERIISAEVLNKLQKAAADKKFILAGDLNAGPDSPVLASFLTHWQNTASTPLPTVPVNKPRTQIDYILFSPSVHARVLECRVPDEQVASDHRAIFAEIELAP